MLRVPKLRTALPTALAGLALALAAGAPPASAQEEPAPVPPGSPSAAWDAPCSPVELVVARGTSEPGPLGVIVGDPLVAQLRTILPEGRVNAYPVNYPASIAAESTKLGATDTVAYVTARAAKCPAARFVLVGYSTGSIAITGATGGENIDDTYPDPISGAAADQVAGVILLSNPLNKYAAGDTAAFANRTIQVCRPDDFVCSPTGTSVIEHIKYVEGDSANAAYYAYWYLLLSCDGGRIFSEDRCIKTFWP